MKIGNRYLHLSFLLYLEVTAFSALIAEEIMEATQVFWNNNFWARLCAWAIQIFINQVLEAFFFYNGLIIILELSSISTSMCLYVLLNSSVYHTQIANRVGVGFLSLFRFASRGLSYITVFIRQQHFFPFLFVNYATIIIL